MNELSIILAGFSAVSCVILFFVYLFYLPDMQKTVAGKFACGGLLLTLAVVQITHVVAFTQAIDLLSSKLYSVLLAAIPVMLFFFSRELLFHGGKPAVQDLVHILPLVVVLYYRSALRPLPRFCLVAGTRFTYCAKCWSCVVICRVSGLKSSFSHCSLR